MADLVALKKRNIERWNAAKLTRGPEFVRPARIAVDHKAVYEEIERRCGVLWEFVAVTHLRESSQDFTKNLGQGDPLNQVTKRVPAGRGPFLGPTAFIDGAVDALVNCAPYAARLKDWSIGGMLTNLERYNGLAYANAGRPSPYIWSGTDQYKIGKVLRDHGPIEAVVDKQLGCAGMILAMKAIDPSITFDGAEQDNEPAPVYDALWLQESLNILGAFPKLNEDGILGGETRKAVRAFQAAHGLRIDGVAGTTETIPAIVAARRALANSHS